MSRKIKYRVWDEEKKKYCTEYNAMTLKHDGEFCIERGWCIISGGFEVEQSTLLKDKNGKEIYEGDILETCCGKAEVYFDDELLMYRIKVKHGGTMPLVSKKSKRHFDYEIIGNIHENPELLEKVKELEGE